MTARIVQALESNLLPWRRPWRAIAAGSQPGRHSNVASRKPYQGVNPLLLELHALRLGLLSRWWGTFNQWHDLGCRIRKRPPDVEEGHWGCRVVFWKPLTKTVVDDQTGDEDEERFFVLKTFTVFSADQVEGEAAEEFQVHEDEGQPHAQPDFQPAEELIAATEADIRFGGDRAYYRRPRPPAPSRTTAKATSSCCRPRRPSTRRGRSTRPPSTSLPTGAEVRTGWDHDKHGYALGELAAEIASATSPPNSASRRAKVWGTMPPTCGTGWRR